MSLDAATLKHAAIRHVPVSSSFIGQSPSPCWKHFEYFSLYIMKMQQQDETIQKSYTSGYDEQSSVK